VERINLLICLYFPQLKDAFENFRKKKEAFLNNRESGLRNGEDLKDDLAELSTQGEKLEQQIAALCPKMA